MTAGWALKPLRDLVVGGDISYGVVQPGQPTEGGVPIVRVKDLAAGHIDVREPMRVAPQVAARHNRTSLKGGELLVTIVGTVGETAVVPPDMEGWNVARAVAVIRPEGVSAQWLSYCLQAPPVRAEFHSMLNTTVQATLNLSDLKRLAVPVPPACQRDGIVAVLGALDGKLEGNAEVLRAVDELLSTCFGQLTDGCETWVPLSTIASVNARTVKPCPAGRVRYLDISSVGVGRYDLPPLMPWQEAPGRARRGLRRGDTLWSTVRPSRRSHALNLSDDPDLVASTGLAVLTPTTVGFAYLYEVTRTPAFTSYLESVAEGSAYPAVRAERFGEALVPLAEARERAEFESYASALRDLVATLAVESRGLAELRDTLLPELMSGRLQVKDAEGVLEEYV